MKQKQARTKIPVQKATNLSLHPSPSPMISLSSNNGVPLRCFGNHSDVWCNSHSFSGSAALKTGTNWFSHLWFPWNLSPVPLPVISTLYMPISSFPSPLAVDGRIPARHQAEAEDGSPHFLYQLHSTLRMALFYRDCYTIGVYIFLQFDIVYISTVIINATKYYMIIHRESNPPQSTKATKFW